MIKKLREQLIDQTGQFCHHAFWLKGGSEETVEILRLFLMKDLLIDPTDLMWIANSSFAVDDSRLVKTFTGGSIASSHRCLIISFDQINLPAQQALLKVLEEPPAGLVLFLVTPLTVDLIPTINSRLRLVNLEPDRSELTSTNFISKDLNARFNQLARLIEQAESTAESRQIINRELAVIEQELSHDLANLKPLSAAAARQALSRVRHWVKTSPQVSAKLLADYLAVSLPRL